MKKFVTLLAVLVIGLSMSGCEKKKVTGRALAPGETLKLQVWTAQEESYFNALGAEFVSALKTPGLAVKVTKFATQQELETMLVDQMAEGRGPDVVVTTGDWLYRNPGKVVPMVGDQTYTAANLRNTFVRAGVDATIRGEAVYGIPLAVDTLAVVYNEDHVVSRLVDSNQPGDTWLKFKEHVAQLTRKNNSFERFEVSGAALGRSDNITHGVTLLETIMMQMGTSFFSEDEISAEFASSGGVTPQGKRQNFGTEAVNFYTSFANEQYKNFSWNEFLTDDPEWKDFQTFAEGKTSMVFATARDFKKIKELVAAEKEVPESSVRVSFLPQMEDPATSNTRVVGGHVWVMSVPRTTQSPDGAWALLKFATKQGQQKSLHDQTGWATARLDLISEQASEPHIGVFARQAKFAVFNPMPIDRVVLWQHFAELITAVNQRTGTVESMLEKLESEMSDILMKRWHLRRQLTQDEKPKENAPTN